MIHQVKQGLKQSLLPCSMFENMGFRYLGPVDGHNLADLTSILRYARQLDEPVLLHVKTVKGKGFLPAEENPDAFHGVGPFHPITGEPLSAGGENFSARFGADMVQLAQADGRVCAITAAMTGGTGLETFAREFPDRFFDVGIAEGCAVSMAAGMAKEGAVPVFAVYSTFLQRSYDMLLHDVALQGLHVVLGVDRAGLVGEDGETHQGLFDVAYLNSVPGMTVLAPASFAELDEMLKRAVLRLTGPVAVRYPRGGEGAYTACAGEEPATLLRSGVRRHPGQLRGGDQSGPGGRPPAGTGGGPGRGDQAQPNHPPGAGAGAPVGEEDRSSGGGRGVRRPGLRGGAAGGRPPGGGRSPPGAPCSTAGRGSCPTDRWGS